MRDELTAEELEIVEALRDCEESAISRVLPRREKMRQIEQSALRKIRRRIVHDANLREAFAQLHLTLEHVRDEERR